jgi:putative heme-binding domain-containing protein
VRRVVLSGFGTEDTHHNLHTLRWGHDGRLWMNQSIYTRTDTETPHGVVRLKSGGVMRLHPGTLKLDIMYRGFWNSWGHQFDQFGQSFLTDGAGSSGINWAFPGATFEAYAGARRVLKGISPGSYPKFCSLEIVYSQHFPDDWQGDMITCDFRANRVVRFKVMEEGAGYVAVEAGDLLRSKEVSFRPIDVKLGPDGALYIADWSNPIIQHGEVDFRDPRRDHEHGRIWRVTCKGRPLNPRPQLVKATNTELLDKLKSPNGYERAQGRRVLIERGKAVSPDLAAWLDKQKEERALLEGLWMLIHLGEGDLTVNRRLLRAADGRIRAAAVRALGENLADSLVMTFRLFDLVHDEHPRVRLEALRVMGREPPYVAFPLRALDKPMDRFLDYALWLTMNELADAWLAWIENFGVEDATEKHLVFGLNALPSDKSAQILAKLLDKGAIKRDAHGVWMELAGQAGGPEELRRLFDQVNKPGFDDPALLRALSALDQAARLRRVQPAGDLQPLGKLLEDKRSAIRAAAIHLAGRWHQQGLTPRIVALAADEKSPIEVRTAAVEALRELRGPEALTALETLAKNDKEATALRRQALLALVAIDPDKSLPLALEAIRSAEDAAIEEFWRSLLGLSGMGKRLTESLQKEPLPKAAAAVGLKVARENDESQRELVALLAKQAGVPPPRVYSNAELGRLSAQTVLRGDPARGELVYRKTDQRCMVCHAIGGAGGKVGPDLTSIGASAPLDYLVESVLLPNRKIKEGFHSLLISTQDGRVLTGILARETPQEVVLRDANDKEIVIPRSNIDERTNAGSLMPSALVDNLSEQERLDLFRFLAELGKPGPFDATKSKSPRVWRVHSDPASPALTAIPTTVAGALLKAEAQAAVPKDAKTAVAETRFEAPKAGRVSFTFDPQGVRAIRIDGKAVTVGKDAQIDLDAGPHTLVVELDLAQLPKRFVLSSAEVVFLAGQ